MTDPKPIIPDPGKGSDKHPIILPPPDAEDIPTIPEDPDRIIPDDEDDLTPPYEAPEPGEGP